MSIRTITARELLDLAQEIIDMHGDEALVVTACDYGDRCHTQQIIPISSTGEFEEKVVKESAYSQSGYAIRDDRGDDEDEESIKVIVIN